MTPDDAILHKYRLEMRANVRNAETGGGRVQNGGRVAEGWRKGGGNVQNDTGRVQNDTGGCRTTREWCTENGSAYPPEES